MAWKESQRPNKEAWVATFGSESVSSPLIYSNFQRILLQRYLNLNYTLTADTVIGKENQLGKVVFKIVCEN